MDQNDLKTRATLWIESWNTRDLGKIMDHYADDVELCSPFVVDRWQLAEGRINGKDKLKDHFVKAFSSGAVNNLELVGFLAGVHDFILLYKDSKGVMSADLVELNDAGKVKTVKSFYTKDQ
ncbi:MAG: nuclear transport factor 2 family protein [Chryseolinea sp.]